MIPAITEHFGNEAQWATLHQATVTLSDMGDRTISTQVRIDGDHVPNFSNWWLEFKGEKFILPIRDPQALKDNSSRNSIIDLTFYSWATYQMKRFFFMSLSQISANVAIPNKYNASIVMPVENFVELFNKVLRQYFGNKIRMDLYNMGQGYYSNEPVAVEINNTYIWDVLIKFYELFNLRWRIVYEQATDTYAIKVNYPAEVLDDHDFEYGYEGGLLRFERQVQDDDIRNILLGRGGERNLPYRYFKLEEEAAGSVWAGDPDAIPELSNIYFERLRDINFRWYVRGWMHNPNRDTSGDEAWDPGHVFPTYEISDTDPHYWAYQKGLTDLNFDPVEYEKDDESIAKFGERWGALDDDDDIYPTIQNVSRDPIGRVDEVVSVGEIVTDDIDKGAEAAAVESNITGGRVVTHSFGANETIADKIKSDVFTIPEGSTGNISYTWMNPQNNKGEARPLILLTTNCSVTVEDTVTGNELPISAIPAGSYRLVLRLEARNSSGSGFNYVSYGLNTVKLVTSVADANAWKPTFDIWVKNIWGTTQGEQETDTQYAARVWEPILGDRTGGEAKIVFSDGFMSISQDYEFTLASYPVKDRSKSIGGVNSEWKITLYKSDAEFDATGLFIPNTTTGGKPVAGDHFFFTGIDMPHQYVIWAEERINQNKVENLDEVKDINPSWVIGLDKVRVHTQEAADQAGLLADRLAAGTMITIKDRRFTNNQQLSLYIQTLTYTWQEPTQDSPYLVPDIEVVLSDKVVAVGSPVEKLNNDVSVIRSTYAKVTDIEDVVRRVATPLFLKKTGESDSSESPTSFGSAVRSKSFRQGAVGGEGWGHYLDGEGHSVLELDKLVVRQELQVNSLVANQISYEGGKQITSAASIECTQVEETDTGYICYFDQKRGSVANHFQVGDIAMGQMFDPENNEERYYRAAVTAVSDYSITLSKTQKDGQGAPQSGDIIVQYGNLTDASRQYVIIRDVIGGGYERMLSGLNAVNASGLEYYFAGKQVTQSGGQTVVGDRWFVGDINGEHAEWKNGVLNITGRISVRKGDGTYESMADYIDSLEYLTDALADGTTVVEGGLILTNLIQLGQTESGVFKVYSGINGHLDQTLQDPTTSIAAWYGGEMLEKTAWDAMTPEQKAAHTYAKSLFRHDGSGYLASGNIGWDAQGSGHIPGISWEGNSVLISGDVKLASLSGDSVTELLTLVRNLNNWFGEDANGDIYVKRNGITPRNFYSFGGVTAYGVNGSGGGGGGGVNLERVWQSLTNNTDFPDVEINAAHIPYGLGFTERTDAVSGVTYFDANIRSVVKGTDVAGGAVTTANGVVTIQFPTAVTGIEYARDLLDADDLCFVDPEEGEEIEIDDPGVTGTVLWGSESNSQVQLDVNGTSKWLLKPDAISGIESSVGIILGYFVSGSARNAIKLNGHEDSYFATASSLSDLADTVDGLVTGVSSVAGKSGDVTLAITDITGLQEALASKLEVAVTSLGTKTGAITLGAGLAISNDNVLSVTGQTMGTVTRVDLGSTQYAPDVNGVVGLPAYPTTLPASDVYAWAKKASLDVADVPDITTSKVSDIETWISGKGYITGITSVMVTSALGYTPFDTDDFTKANIQSELGIYDWALAANAPTYSFADLTSHPTTLGGYGITDANFSSAGVADKIRITLGNNYHDVLTAHQSLEDYATKTYVGQQGFITKAVNDLTNYYLKSETYTQTEVNNIISGLNLGTASQRGVASVISADNANLTTSGLVYSYVNTMLSSVLKWVGETTTDIESNPSANPIIIGGQSYTAVAGNVVSLSGTSKEFRFDGTLWKEMGDEASYAYKTISITGTGYLTGGGTLEANRTIDIATNVKSLIDNAVPNTRKVNNHALSADISLDKTDVGLGNVDNLAASGYFTLLTNDNNQISVTIGGTNKKLTVAYAGLAGNASLLENHAASYFATASDLSSVSGRVTTLEGWKNTWDDIFGIDGNGDVYVKANGNTPRNFYSLGGVSAYGTNSGGGGGGGIDLARVWESLSTNTDTYGSTKVHIDHIPAIAISGVTGLQTALDGKQAVISDLSTIRSNASDGETAYGWGNHATQGYLTGITSQMISSALGYTPMDIDDAFIEDGDIHINGQTITPLVAADLAGYANTVQASGTGNYVSAVSKAANSNVITVTYGTLPTVITAARDLDDADDLCFVDPEEGEDVEIDDPGTTGTVLWGSESASQVSLDVNGVSKTLLKAAALDGINSSIGVLLGYFSSGAARNALALGGHGADYFATASGLSELETEVSGLVTGVSSVVGQEGDVTVTQIANALTSAGYKLTDTIYTLPIAGASTLGGIKIGAGLSIDGSGVVSVTGQTQGTVTRVDVGSTQYSPDLNGVVGLPSYPTTLPASDVYDWAKAATKPSYTFSEIGSKPDTLAGYGITDAKFSSAGVSDKIRITLGTNYHDVLTAHQSLSNYYDKTETNSLISEAIEDLELGDAATYGVGSVASGDNGLVTGGQVWSAISAIPTGTVTSVDLSVPTGLSVSGGPITSSGTLAISLATGYSIPLTADTNKGVTAYGWGDHSLAGYFAAADFTQENIQSTLGISDWALAATKPSYTNSEVGLGNVTNDAQVKRTEMGAASGVATLGSDGKIPSSQLPSYVDDVLEYASRSAFPETGESGKIYVALDTNKTYRWSGTTYTEISPSVVIGTTTGTAFDGGSGYSHVTNDDIHVTASQKTAWTAKYDKPSGGIPKSDLASAVQTSLGLADTAFQTSSFTKANIQSTLGISNWALEANKPSYTFSEIGSTPTSIDGYGIDDAYIEDHDIHLGNESITVLAADTVYNLVVKNSAGTPVLTYNPANVSGGELTLTKAMVGLGNVENTALSSWAGTQNINTLGTITTGVWHGTAIGNEYLALDMSWTDSGRTATHDSEDYIHTN